MGRRLSSLLAVTISRALDALGYGPKDIDYFACGLGPGSFTGIRVGVSAVKGLSWVLKKPVIGIATLDILARNINIKEGFIVPAVDAKRNLIYCSIYQKKPGELKRIRPYMLISPDEFCRTVRAHSFVLGDAVGLYRQDMLKNIKGVNLAEKDHWYPNAYNLIDIALEKIKSRKVTDAFEIKPIYLYPKECQVKK
jgi:tRNA threonylcarbamoyladenosine biosynthesis protein TsaB